MVRNDDLRVREDETATFQLLERGQSEPRPINYDETLNNLTTIMLKKTFTRNDLDYFHQLNHLGFKYESKG